MMLKSILKKLLLESVLSNFRGQLEGEQYEPYSSAEWAKVVSLMRDPNTPELVKAKIKRELPLKNLRLLIPIWRGANGITPLDKSFTYVDEQEFLDIALDKILNLVDKYDWNRDEKYISFVRRSIVNALIDLNKKNQKHATTHTSIDAFVDNEDGEGIKSSLLNKIEKSKAGNEPKLSEFMNNPEFKKRIGELKDKLNRNQKMVVDWILHPNYKDIRVSEIVKFYNQRLAPGERPLTDQTLNAAKKIVFGLIERDPVLKRIMDQG